MRASAPKPTGPVLILGLCNPGEEYENTYHNAGGLFADYLASDAGTEFRKAKYFEYAKVNGFVVVKSLTYMNESGIAAAAALKYFQTPIAQLVVAHDDSDLTLGSFKITVGQNAAGHHGIESVINTLGTKEFSRIRIGVRPQEEKRRKKAGEFVLKKIGRKDRETLMEAFGKVLVSLGVRSD